MKQIMKLPRPHGRGVFSPRIIGSGIPPKPWRRGIKTALTNALATTAYITVVASFMFFAGQVRLGVNNSLLVPIAMLLLFVSSAGITSWLVFGKPAQLFLGGKKKEALTLLGYTLGLLLAITFIVIILLIIFNR